MFVVILFYLTYDCTGVTNLFNIRFKIESYDQLSLTKEFLTNRMYIYCYQEQNL